MGNACCFGLGLVCHQIPRSTGQIHEIAYKNIPLPLDELVASNPELMQITSQSILLSAKNNDNNYYALFCNWFLVFIFVVLAVQQVQK